MKDPRRHLIAFFLFTIVYVGLKIYVTSTPTTKDDSLPGDFNAIVSKVL